jgi:hypothetical protein
MLEVHDWSIGALKSLFVNRSEASPARIDQKFHSRYFEDYFSHPDIQAKRIVVEANYVDRDFLEDFASYYVRCFKRYERHCTRLHFFDIEFNNTDVESLIVGEDCGITLDQFRAAYIGFIVLRNLPQTIIGRTCLKTYGDDAGRRRYPITRQYQVSLYGIPLTVESLGFQEQDSVAGACATSALWTVLQGTGRTFQHGIPTPVEITNLADQHKALEARRSPSRGLTAEQALRVIEAIGLYPHQVPTADRYTFTSTLYAYLRGNIPIYMGEQLHSATLLPGAPRGVDGTQTSLIGGHAVAVTGFSLGGSVLPQGSSEFRLRSTQIDRVYVHDDQVGPFARMHVADYSVTAPGQAPQSVFALDSTLPAPHPGRTTLAKPDHLIVPLYHKIRIPYSFVQWSVISFDAVMKDALNGASAGYDTQKLTWDIFLVTGSQYMDRLRKRNDLKREHRLALATKPLPRFFWHASLFYDGTPAMTILFDATDLEQGDVVVHIVEEDDALCGAARALAAAPSLKAQQELAPNWRIWNWFIQNPVP